MFYAVLLVVAPITALVAVTSLRARRPGGLSRILSWLTVGLLILWLVDSVLFITDYKDADGFVDCSQGDCSALQVFAGLTFGLGSVAFAVIAVVALIAAAVHRASPRGQL
jgi:hypothetical protein